MVKCDAVFGKGTMGNASRSVNATTSCAAEQPRQPRIRVGFVLIPRFTLTAFACFVDVLRLAGDEHDRSRQLDCHWTVLGDSKAPVISSCGASVKPWGEMANPGQFDYIVVVGGLVSGGREVLPDTHAFLREAAQIGVGLVGLCTGSFVLARAGVMKGYAACVSWFHRADFEREFPRVRVSSQRLFVIDGKRLTCAGGISVVHLAAFLIEKHCCRAQAVKSLRILIADQPRPSISLQPSPVIPRQGKDSVVIRAMLLIEQKLLAPDQLVKLFAALGVGLRQLERRFIADIGITPRDYRIRLRLERARWMIVHTDLSVTDIGLDCGFGTCSHFSRAFSNHFKTSPSRLRHPDSPDLWGQV